MIGKKIYLACGFMSLMAGFVEIWASKTPISVYPQEQRQRAAQRRQGRGRPMPQKRIIGQLIEKSGIWVEDLTPQSSLKDISKVFTDLLSNPLFSSDKLQDPKTKELMHDLVNIVYVLAHDPSIALKNENDVKMAVITLIQAYRNYLEKPKKEEKVNLRRLAIDLKTNALGLLRDHSDVLVQQVKDKYEALEKNWTYNMGFQELLEEKRETQRMLNTVRSDIDDLYKKMNAEKEAIEEIMKTITAIEGRIRNPQAKQTALRAEYSNKRIVEQNKRQIWQDIEQKKNEKTELLKKLAALDRQLDAIQNLTDALYSFDEKTVYLLNNDALVKEEDLGRLDEGLILEIFNKLERSAHMIELVNSMRVEFQKPQLRRSAFDTLQRYITHAYSREAKIRNAQGFGWELAVGVFLEKALKNRQDKLKSFSIRFSPNPGEISKEFDLSTSKVLIEAKKVNWKNRKLNMQDIQKQFVSQHNIAQEKGYTYVIVSRYEFSQDLKTFLENEKIYYIDPYRANLGGQLVFYEPMEGLYTEEPFSKIN